MNDNQPVIKDGVIVFHNGIIVNDDEVWKSINQDRTLEIDSEVIAGIVLDEISKNTAVEVIPEIIFDLCKGTISSAILVPKLGKLLLLSNNGSLYLGKIGKDIYFASEKFSLSQQNCTEITQVKGSTLLDVPKSNDTIELKEYEKRRLNLVPQLSKNRENEKLLEYKRYIGQRCKKCILPETMPYIVFDVHAEPAR